MPFHTTTSYPLILSFISGAHFVCVPQREAGCCGTNNFDVRDFPMLRISSVLCVLVLSVSFVSVAQAQERAPGSAAYWLKIKEDKLKIEKRHYRRAMTNVDSALKKLVDTRQADDRVFLVDLAIGMNNGKYDVCQAASKWVLRMGESVSHTDLCQLAAAWKVRDEKLTALNDVQVDVAMMRELVEHQKVNGVQNLTNGVQNEMIERLAIDVKIQAELIAAMSETMARMAMKMDSEDRADSFTSDPVHPLDKANTDLKPQSVFGRRIDF